MRCYSRRPGADLTDGADLQNKSAICSLASAPLFAPREAFAAIGAAVSAVSCLPVVNF
jgi:hypothetical protein